MKKFICSLILSGLVALNCFAGTLHIKYFAEAFPSSARPILYETTIECKYDKMVDGIVFFKKPDGSYIMVGHGIEWWYESDTAYD